MKELARTIEWAVVRGFSFLLVGFLGYAIVCKWSQFNADFAYIAAVLRGAGLLP